MTANRANSYQKSLRAIGQGLETLGVERFELETHSDTFVVHGYCKGLRSDRALRPSLLREAFRYLRQSPKPRASGQTRRGGSSSSFEFTGLRFTRKDVDRFELKGKAVSVNGAGTPNPHRLSQVMRLAGAYLDYKGSHLVKLAWQSGCITLWRKDGFREQSKDIFTPENLYDFWVHQYKRRKPGQLIQILKKTGND